MGYKVKVLLSDDGRRPPTDVKGNYSLSIYTVCLLCVISW